MERFVCATCRGTPFSGSYTREALVAHVKSYHAVPQISTKLEQMEGVQIRYMKWMPYQLGFVDTPNPNIWVNAVIHCDGQDFLVETKEHGNTMSVWISAVGFSGLVKSPYTASLCYVQQDGLFPEKHIEIQSWTGFVEPTTAFTNHGLPAFSVSSTIIWNKYRYNERDDFCWNLRLIIFKDAALRERLANWGGGKTSHTPEELERWGCLLRCNSPSSPGYLLNLMCAEPIYELNMPAYVDYSGMGMDMGPPISSQPPPVELEIKPETADELPVQDPDKFTKLYEKVVAGMIPPTQEELDMVRKAFVLSSKYDESVLNQ